ncbi:MAG: hypothetical protein DRH08_15885, partial [Deltaproteobacteria bacterium]
LLIINPAQVSAVGLGEMNVKSQLGQPLNATVPITLAAGESIPKNCVAPTRNSSGIGSPTNLKVTTPAATQAGTYNLRVTTTNPLHEPMYEISLLIDCPGTPVLLRQYVLMLDLPIMTVNGTDTAVADFSATNVSSSTTSRGDTLFVPSPTVQPLVQSARSTDPATTRALQQSQQTIPAGKPYRISKGDTLSTIAARVEGRSADTTWSVAKLIFSMNPQAFIRDNPDLIKLGSKIDIPEAAQLVGLAKGRSSSLSVAAVTQTTAQPEPANEPRPTPVPAPIPASVAIPDATNRQEVSVSKPEPEQLATNTQEAIADTSAATTAVADQPVVTQPAETEALDTDAISPFLDEQPAPVSITEGKTAAVTDPVVQPIAVATTTNIGSSKTVNPLLAILVGMLLGLIGSVLMFRRQIISTLTGLTRSRKPRPVIRTDAQPEKQAEEEIVAEVTDVDSFDTAEANSAFVAPNSASAFDTSSAESVFNSQQNEIEPLPIKEAMESTYIVETSAAIVETSAAETAVLNDVESFDPGTLENTGELPVNGEDEMLSQLFDESASTLDDQTNEIFDPTGGMDAALSGTIENPATPGLPEWIDEQDQGFDATMELPSESDHDTLGPTAEMPVRPNNALLDETALMPADSDEDLVPSLTTELDGILDDIDADELFATSDNLAGEAGAGSPMDEISDSPTITSHLIELPSEGADNLSQTMQDAMSLLEQDFDDEFTASQILERPEIKRLLDGERDEETEDTNPLPGQKVSS